MSNAAETLKAAVAALGLTYKADFVPFSKSRNAKKATKPCDYSLNWKITLSKGSRSIETDYMQGIGFVPGQRASAYRLSIAEFDRIKQACETGKYAQETGFIPFKTIPAPEAHDVMHSLVLDSSVLDAGSFEEWAGDFGYETDSRSAEKIYHQCMDIALRLRAMIGDEGIKSLQVAGQDY